MVSRFTVHRFESCAPILCTHIKCICFVNVSVSISISKWKTGFWSLCVIYTIESCLPISGIIGKIKTNAHFPTPAIYICTCISRFSSHLLGRRLRIFHLIAFTHLFSYFFLLVPLCCFIVAFVERAFNLWQLMDF